MTQPQLSRACLSWQKRLRLQDWRISINFGTEQEMTNPYPCDGLTHYSPEEMTATILIAAEQDDADEGIEKTIIHELLHLVIHGDRELEKYEVMTERAINQIADALYGAYRRKRS